MFKHLRRWHFDLAIFLGLTMFAWAFWNSLARPLWQRLLCDPEQLKLTQSHLLKFSSDQQYLSVFIEGNELLTGNAIRRIEHRRCSDGSLLQQIPLEQPMGLNEDPANPTTVEYAVFGTWLAAQWTSTKESLCQFYSALDGKLIGSPMPTRYLPHVPGGETVPSNVATPRPLQRQRFAPIKQPSIDGHTWALQFTIGSASTTPTHLYDLHTGILLKTFVSPLHTARFGTLTPDGNHFIVCWVSNHEYEIEVFRVDNWTSIERSKSHAADLNTGTILDDGRFIVVDRTRSPSTFRYPRYRINCYQLDASSGALSPDTSHPLHDMTSENRLSVEPPLLVESSVEQNVRFDLPALQTLEQWLARIGLQRDYSQRLSYLISDMTSGKPLRSIRNLPSEPQRANADWTQLIQLRTRQFGIYDTLVCYPVHSVAWNNTLSWLQWLSWLLVIPWPLRYFVRQPIVTSLPS